MYNEFLKMDKNQTIDYFKKSIIKTEQQKFLETLIKSSDKNLKIADIACGGGTLSYHLKSIFTKADFSLLDFNADGIENSRQVNPESRFSFFQNDMFSSPFKNEYFDYTFFWQTLAWIEPEEAPKMLDEILRITKKGGKVFVSSLFNLDFDTDILTKVIDYTRPSGQANLSSNYNTYCQQTIQKWIGEKVSNFKIYKFEPSIDFAKTENRGLATFTKKTEFGERLQISGGMLLNWGILEITK